MDGHIFLIGLLLSVNQVSALWTCTLDSECYRTLSGSICSNGVCECGPGTQGILGGTVCREIAPYHMSPCREDHQCGRLFSGFHCRISDNSTEGNCMCQPGFHYLYGRCWRSLDFGADCIQSEECLGIVRDPFSLVCDGTCRCAAGYVERQRGDCRKVGLAEGDGCVLDQDCQFPNAICDLATFTCITSTPEIREITEESELLTHPMTEYNEVVVNEMAEIKTTVQRVVCNDTALCESPFVCSSHDVCICPLGYYESDDGRTCLAELGSPSQPEQCVGLLAEVIDGICMCRPNFFYEDNMRDCIRVTRRITESCVLDTHCHTFGLAARCGPAQEWGLRTCECIPEISVWTPNLNLCRYFSGIGESCEVNSDCLAGELEIQCVVNDGVGVCACPDELEEFEGLCLTSGLLLGEICQHTRECTGTPNMMCDGVCTCNEGYQAIDDTCVPSIGGSCITNTDCVIENTVCRNTTTGFSCQCNDNFLAYDNTCWPAVAGHNATCSVSAQCVDALGQSGDCVEGVCSCIESAHYRDGGCWPVTGLFEPCARTSQCFLGDISHRVVCRNSQCQCDFSYTFSEERQTCLSSSATYISASLMLIVLSLLFQ